LGKLQKLTRFPKILSKMDGNCYKVKNNMSIDSFHLLQVYSTALKLEYKKGGIIILKNHVIAKMLQMKKKKKEFFSKFSW
jgi:hypothetical protein